MTIIVNGERRDIAAATLHALLERIGLSEAVVATALNGEFVPASARARTGLKDGDAVEILAPMQGG